MYETPEPGYHIVSCDYCCEELEIYCDWLEFHKTIYAQGWAMTPVGQKGLRMHLCPACNAEGVKIRQLEQQQRKD